MGISDTIADIRNNFKLFAQEVKGEAVEESIRQALRTLVLKLVSTVESFEKRKTKLTATVA